jgi:hypothetical protein
MSKADFAGMSLTLMRRSPRQAATFLSAMGELLTEREDGLVLARALGSCIAGGLFAPDDDSVSSLERALNRSLAQLDLGVVSLDSRADALVIEVSEYPAINARPGQAELVVFGLFEGLLTTYLNGLSGIENLSARIEHPPMDCNDALQIFYTKH